MKEKEFRRNMAVFPIGSVMKLTDLSARQIRYYEEQNLITPLRNEGNRRMYSLKVIISPLSKRNMLSVKLNPTKRLVKRKSVELSTMIFYSKVVLALLCQPLVTCVDRKLFLKI